MWVAVCCRPPAERGWARHTAQVTAQQNADGSYGSGVEQVLQTARFVVGMLNDDVDWAPYRNQLKKAGMFLLGNAHHHSLGLLALRLLVQKHVFNKDSIRKTIEQMIEELPTEQAALLKTADDDAIAKVLSSHGIHVNRVELLRELCKD